MGIRITQDVLYRNSLYYMQRGLRKVEQAQMPLLTGNRIDNPSDDPYGTVRVIKLKEEQANLENYQNNIDMVTGWQESGATALQSLSTLLTQVKALTVEGATGSLNQDDRDTLASQIDQSLTEAISLANSHFGGRYLFGGTRTGSAPYAAGSDGDVDYLGNDNVNYAWISSGTRIATNIPGSDIFTKMSREATIYSGSTGAASGSGTDSGSANDTLSVIHDTTTYGGATGIAAGASSGSGDTIIGPAGTHSITVTVTSPTTGTIRLDGGETVTYDTTAPGAADFEVTNEDGDGVFVDLTGPLVTGTDTITSTGFLSLDGGATLTAIDFSTSQLVEDSVTGEYVHVNSTGIERTGEEYLTFPGTFSLFEVLASIRDDLENTRDLSLEDQIESISGRLADLEVVHENVLAAMSEFGGRSMRVEMTANRLEDFDLNIQELIAETQEADISEAIMELEMANQSLQLAQSVTSQILSATLLKQYG